MTRSQLRTSVACLLGAVGFVLVSALSAWGQTPQKWVFSGGAPEDYEMGGNPGVPHGSDGGGYIRSKVTTPRDFGTLATMVRPDAYLGKRLRLAAYVRTENVATFVGLWMRVDGPNGRMLALDNMDNRPIKGTTDWKTYDVVLDVEASATQVAYGIILEGPGLALVDGLTLETVGPDVPVTGSALGWSPNGRYAEDYEMGGTPTVAHGAPGGGYIFARAGQDPRGAGMLATYDVSPAFLGKRVRLSAFVRTENAARAGFWVQVGNWNSVLSFDDMRNRSITGTTDWKQCSSVVEVPPETEVVSYGMVLDGKGKVWFDGLTLEAVGTDVPLTQVTDPSTAYSKGAFAEAVKALPSTLRLDPTNYSWRLLYFLSLHRSGQVKQAQAYLATLASDYKDAKWPEPIVGFLGGRLSEAELLKAATSAEDETIDAQQNCEAYYYLGVAYLVNLGKVPGGGAAGAAKAREYFEKSVATNVQRYIEYMAAKAELERMKR